jgi:hypothetical protein
MENRGVLIKWSENPVSSVQGGFAQVKIMLSTSSSNMIEKQQSGDSSLKLKCEYSAYLFLEYMFVILLKGMQHVLYDKYKVHKTLRENP